MKTNQRTDITQHSALLDKEITLHILGDNGIPCLVFMPMKEGIDEFCRYAMTKEMKSMLNRNQVRFFLCDCFHDWTSSEITHQERMSAYETWLQFLQFEMVPYIRSLSFTNDFMVCGIEIGALHAMNIYLRQPQIINKVLCLSGIYKPSYYVKRYYDEYMLKNTPGIFLRSLDEDQLAAYRNANIILCASRHPSEYAMEAYLHEMEEILRVKDIPALVEYWEYEALSNWDWWSRQLDYFLPLLLARSFEDAAIG